ncbi:MAG: creatininase family protein, partial [Firmicutes bacterium]|nr:creatininase family protein [Bacillota bacterium]
FKNIIVLLGHGGTDNRAALKNTLQMLLRRDENLAKKITLSLVECWDLSPTWLDGFRMEPEHDFHAGMMETALMMYWAPENVRSEIVQDEDYYARMMRTDQDWFEKRTSPIDTPYIIETVGQRDEIKVGVMGLPERATPELGEKICGEIVDNLVAYVDKLENFRKNK